MDWVSVYGGATFRDGSMSELEDAHTKRLFNASILIIRR